jgi:hypothetical protein
MANVDTPFGLRPISNMAGMGVANRVRPYTVLAADAVAMFVGDLVKLTGTEAISDDGFTYPVVAQAAATNTCVGVVIGFKINPDYLGQIHRTASTLRTAIVVDDPYAIFEAQVNGTLVAADVGLNADITVGSGSTILGLSAMEVDQSTVKSATDVLRILRVLNSVDNETGANAKVEVMINEHQYKSTVGA